MAITFHCEHCGKKIEASDAAAGKWGKCPACHNRVYVPQTDSGDELKLAPIDESEEQHRKDLMAETQQLTHDILQEQAVPSALGYGGPVMEISEKELLKNIILYLRQMADGDLDEAQQTAEKIVPYRKKALLVIDKIAGHEHAEPELADIPQDVLTGFTRNLRTRLS